MHKLFHRFGRKNEKLLKRELALAHTCIVFLSIGMVALLSFVYDKIGTVNHALIIAACALLLLVAIFSASVVGYIVKTRK